MSEYQMKPGKIGKKVIGAYEKVEKTFTNTFLEANEASQSGYRLKTGKTADAVTGAYKKFENSITSTYQKVEDAFVDAFLENTDKGGRK